MTTTYELINPPQDVTTALANLQAACSTWQAAPVVRPSHGPLAIPPPPPAQTSATEAMACPFVQNPNDYMLHQFYPVLWLLGILLLITVLSVWASGLYQLPGALCRLVIKSSHRLGAALR